MGVMTPVPERAPRSAAFQTEIARLWEAILGYAWTGLMDRPPRLIFRRPPSQLRTPGQRVLLGFDNFVQRMFLPVLVTTFTASWANGLVWTSKC